VQQRNPVADNDNRPVEFDTAILQWLPFLHKMAARLERNKQDREDLVNETIAAALQRWESYDPSTSLPGWLAFQMRGCCRAMRDKRGRGGIMFAPLAGITVSALDETYTAPTLPRQDDVVELAQVTAKLEGRNGNILMRVSEGENGEVLAAEYGVSRQRIEQIVKRQRVILRERLNNTVRMAA